MNLHIWGLFNLLRAGVNQTSSGALEQSLATDPASMQTKLRLYHLHTIHFVVWFGNMDTSAGRPREARGLPHAFPTYDPHSSGYAGMTFQKHRSFVDRTNLPCVQDIIAKRRNSLFGHVVRLDDKTPATAHYHRSQQQELAPALVLLAATARTPAPFMDPADRRWYTLQHSCRIVQGSS